MTRPLILILSLLLCTLFTFQEANAQSADKHASAIIKGDDPFSLNKWDCFIYPMPASNELNVKVTKGQVLIENVSILNESGETIMDFNKYSSSKIKLDIDLLPPGKYYVQVRSSKYHEAKLKRFYISN